MRERLQHEHSRALAHDEAAAVQVEGSRRRGGAVIAGRVHRHQVAESGEAQRRQRCLRPTLRHISITNTYKIEIEEEEGGSPDPSQLTCDDDVSVPVADESEGLAQGVGRGGTGRLSAQVRPFGPCLHGHHAGRRVS